MRKKFPCGHVGKGKYCHRCSQEAIAQQIAPKITPAATEDSLGDGFNGDELMGLSGAPKATKLKALEIARDIRAGAPFSRFKGQRLRHDRSIVSVPIGYSWRLVCLDTDEGIEVKGLFTHEEYSKKFGGGGR